MAFHVSENPTLPGVYRVLVYIHGVEHPRPHEPTIYSYYDGVDTWGGWDFSIPQAIRAKPNFKGVRPWTPLEVAL